MAPHSIGPKGRKIIQRDSAISSPSLTREQPFVFSRGKGVYVWDVDSRKYLDFAAGIAVMNCGYSNPSVLQAVKKQLQYGTHAAFSDFYAEMPIAFCETLKKLLPDSLNTMFLSNSGTEAIEAGLKCAKWHTQKEWVIAFRNCFHGRTMGSLSMTNSKPVQRERFGPFLPVMHATYPYVYRSTDSEEECVNRSLDEVEHLMKSKEGNVAAVFVEPIQGEGGYIVPPKRFLPGLKKLCQEHGALLVMDEVQSGCFRTGKFLAEEHFNTVGDIVCLSKAVGGGFPLGVTVANKKIMDWVPGSHANTFGGNLVACAAGKASLDYMVRKKLGKNALERGKEMMETLSDLKGKFQWIGDVRGLGLMIGIEIVNNQESKMVDVQKRDAIIGRSFAKGLLLLPAGISVIRMCPALILSKKEAQKGIDMFKGALLNS